MARWNGKVALVTGGSAGLGLKVAEVLARRGVRLVLCGRGAEALAAAAESLGRSHQTEVLTVAADVTSPDAADELMARTLEKFGRLDALVHCAGRSARGLLAQTPPEQFTELWELNFLSAVRLVRPALGELLKHRGHLVLVGSLASKTASPYLGAYSASKFPLAALAQQLRLEYDEAGLHTLLVCPGPIRRDDEGNRYEAQTADLPEEARRPGGGARLRGLDPEWLAERIVRYCELRRPELVAPRRARLLFVLEQLWPSAGDWLLRRMTK